MRIARASSIAVLGAILCLAAAEVVGRVFFGLEPLHYSRPYDPIFVSGPLTPHQTREQLMRGPYGPIHFGYRRGTIGSFTYDHGFDPVTASDRLDFLFESSPYTRYTAREVDLLTCDRPGAILVFAMGDSLAQGASASSKDATWQALLERGLRNLFKRSDIYVINAAMGAFVSTQVRRAYELADLPHDPQVTVFLNGYNDAVGPLNGGYRPGDVSLTRLRYAQIYQPPWITLLADSSAVFATIYTKVTEARARRGSAEVIASDALFGAYADNVAGIYAENMNAVLQQCHDRGRECLVAIQPFKGAAALSAGIDGHDVMPDRRIRELADRMRAVTESGPFPGDYVSLTDTFASAAAVANFTDTVHLNDAGHRLLAERLLPAVAPLVERSITHPRPRSAFAQSVCAASASRAR